MVLQVSSVRHTVNQPTVSVQMKISEVFVVTAIVTGQPGSGGWETAKS